VLFQLAADGRIVRGRPLGTWLSGQHQWSPAADWLPAGLGDKLAAEEARVTLARAWLASFGPGTTADLQWWAGWTLGQTRKALAASWPLAMPANTALSRIIVSCGGTKSLIVSTVGGGYIPGLNGPVCV